MPRDSRRVLDFLTLFITFLVPFVWYLPGVCSPKSPQLERWTSAGGVNLNVGTLHFIGGWFRLLTFLRFCSFFLCTALCQRTCWFNLPSTLLQSPDIANHSASFFLSYIFLSSPSFLPFSCSSLAVLTSKTFFQYSTVTMPSRKNILCNASRYSK